MGLTRAAAPSGHICLLWHGVLHVLWCGYLLHHGVFSTCLREISPPGAPPPVPQMVFTLLFLTPLCSLALWMFLNACFTRGAATLAEGLSCVLWWVHWAGWIPASPHPATLCYKTLPPALSAWMLSRHWQYWPDKCRRRAWKSVKPKLRIGRVRKILQSNWYLHMGSEKATTAISKLRNGPTAAAWKGLCLELRLRSYSSCLEPQWITSTAEARLLSKLPDLVDKGSVSESKKGPMSWLSSFWLPGVKAGGGKQRFFSLCPLERCGLTFPLHYLAARCSRVGLYHATTALGLPFLKYSWGQKGSLRRTL